MRGRMWIRLMVCLVLSLEGLGGVVWGSIYGYRGVLKYGDIQHNVPEKDVMAVRHSSTRCRSEVRTSL